MVLDHTISGNEEDEHQYLRPELLSDPTYRFKERVRWVNLNSFTTQICGTGVLSATAFAFWNIRMAWEEEVDFDDTCIEVAATWIVRSLLFTKALAAQLLNNNFDGPAIFALWQLRTALEQITPLQKTYIVVAAEWIEHAGYKRYELVNANEEILQEMRGCMRLGRGLKGSAGYRERCES
jgi:hypothetical protein